MKQLLKLTNNNSSEVRMSSNMQLCAKRYRLNEFKKEG